MCAQCVASAASAATAVTAATGLRAWLAAGRPAWLTPRRKRALSVVLLSAGVLAAGAIGT